MLTLSAFDTEFPIAPDTIQGASIRTTDPQGLRFAAYVDEERKSVAFEYGFIVALEESFASENEYLNLVFDNGESIVYGTNDYGINFVSGKAYVTAEPGHPPRLTLFIPQRERNLVLIKKAHISQLFLKE